tara:strand:+ start:2459 stop:4843 length:2385 start_codon:yes stop_codon:yes gene_type:complete
MATIIPNTDTELNKNNVFVGDAFESYLHFLKEEQNFKENEISTLRRETVGHFQNCDFSENGSVGLIIGKIQSGKTTSFTAITALARDNDVPIVIILGGISNVLVKQAADDLMKLKGAVSENLYMKVQVAQRSMANTAVHYVDPSQQSFKQSLQNKIDSWTDDEPEFQQSNVIITMKQTDNINNLTAALENINFNQRKVLIIDDETDQHGLNGQIKKSKISPTNLAIKKLREVVDRTTTHVYLGYTATPVANLLQPLNEHLKPTFVGFITPGNDYIGGEDLFTENSPYIIDDIETYNAEDLDDAPDDLFFALRIFIVGSLIHRLKNGSYKPFYSMLVHPDRTIVSHSKCAKWIQERLNYLKNGIPKSIENLSEEDIETRDAMMDDFRDAYDNLVTTVDQIPDFDEVKTILPSFLPNIITHETNSEEGSGMPDWEEPQANIIVAGDAVNRGTVVKNLTVTYLCRKESKQEDTTQQRGRFYGYKKKYKEYIRVFTTGENSRFFGDYVLAEKSMWQNLQDHIETGKSFDELVFSPIVVKDFKLTRDNVHEKLILNTDKQNWVIPNGPHFDNVRNFNERLVETWLQNNQNNLVDWDQDQCKVYMEDQNGEKVEALKPELNPDERNKQSHRSGLFDFDDVFENLVRGFRSEPIYDKAKVLSIKGWLRNIIAMAETDVNAESLERLKSKIRVFLMSDGKSRERSLASLGDNRNEKLLSQVMSGRSGGRARFERRWYPGDRAFFDPNFFTIQIHKFSIKDEPIDNAWNIALHIPDSIASKYDTAIIDLIDSDTVEDTSEPDE